MKLRNRNTGEIVEFISIDLVDDDEIEFTYAKVNGHENACSYRSLEKFKEEWEDYEPAEPLIKDEKIRKAVRAWWEAVPDAITDKRVFYKNNQDLAIGVYTIYCGAIYPETLEVGKMYTIEELCGDEE